MRHTSSLLLHNYYSHTFTPRARRAISVCVCVIQFNAAPTSPTALASFAHLRLSHTHTHTRVEQNFWHNKNNISFITLITNVPHTLCYRAVIILPSFTLAIGLHCIANVHYCQHVNYFSPLLWIKFSCMVLKSTVLRGHMILIFHVWVTFHYPPPLCATWQEREEYFFLIFPIERFSLLPGGVLPLYVYARKCALDMYGRKLNLPSLSPHSTVQDEFQSKRGAGEHDFRACRWIQDGLAVARGAGTSAPPAQDDPRAARGHGAHVRQVISTIYCKEKGVCE